MGTLKLNNVTAITESGGTVVLDSAVTGIPAAGVTGTLPNAVQDNVTRLGTVTSGNLSNTAIVYPTGHVVQTTDITTLPNNTYTNTTTPSNNTFYPTVVVGKITPIYSNSSTIIHSMFVVRTAESSGDMGYAMRFRKNSTSLTASVPTGMSDYTTSTVHSSRYRNAIQYIDLNDMWHVTFMDSNVGIAGEEVTYTLEVAAYGLTNSGNTIAVGAYYDGYSHTFMQEIKR